MQTGDIIRGQQILYGAFKAMGDFISAAPVIKAELDAGSEVHVLIFPGLESFIRLVDFGQLEGNLHLIPLPVSIRQIGKFFRQMSSISPYIVWISPHAPAAASSWKIPVLMRLMKMLFWPTAILAGSKSERMSRLFDLRSEASRALPFRQRELQSYAVLNRVRDGSVGPVWFRPDIQAEAEKEPLYDLLIHPGAGASNRKLPFDRYASILGDLPAGCKVAVVGLPDDIANMKAALPGDRDIQFISGSLEHSIRTIARAKVLLTMDSGNMFFAQMLGVPAISIFGASDPATVIGDTELVFPIYQKAVPCQPCGNKTCALGEPKCITTIPTAFIARQIINSLSSRQRFGESANYATG